MVLCYDSRNNLYMGEKFKTGSKIKLILSPSLLVGKQIICVTIFILSNNIFVTFY
jgi:hypothetical protein